MTTNKYASVALILFQSRTTTGAKLHTHRWKKTEKEQNKQKDNTTLLLNDIICHHAQLIIQCVLYSQKVRQYQTNVYFGQENVPSKSEYYNLYSGFR